ncbi:MAG: endonuclease YncB(thermonuclease family) [Rickettsiales bacterium]|jgi:endonuclease YncB( thermonuclease family)
MKNPNYQKIISKLLLIIFILSFFFWIFITTQSTKKSQIIKPNNPARTSSQTQIIFGNATIIDGDTIIINRKRIRLIGIDTPETKQKCLDKDNYEYLCGEMATIFLKKLIKNQKVECFSEKKDIYKRYLGICKFDNININHEMVRSGMAVVYNLKEASVELKNLEKTARSDKLGIWQGSFEEPKRYRKRQRRR